MEELWGLASTFWQWSILIVLILTGFLINVFDKRPREKRVNFTYEDMPSMRPLPIKTGEKGFWGAIWMWLTGTRKWELAEDFNYTINDDAFVVPEGFVFDGASVPKFLAIWLSPVGVLLMGGLVHDYGYKYACLKYPNSNLLYTGKKDQKYMDRLFRDICIEVNGFRLLNYLAYYALRICGFLAWNKHKKSGSHDEL